VQRLYEDLEIKCFESVHRIIALGIGIPCLIIWGKQKFFSNFLIVMGIPTFGLIILIINKEILASRDVREKYGFLYNGYKHQSAFYWELVIMYQKIAIIFIRVFLVHLGKIVQVNYHRIAL
jgi:hypothetical protein